MPPAFKTAGLIPDAFKLQSEPDRFSSVYKARANFDRSFNLYVIKGGDSLKIDGKLIGVCFPASGFYILSLLHGASSCISSNGPPRGRKPLHYGVIAPDDA